MMLYNRNIFRILRTTIMAFRVRRGGLLFFLLFLTHLAAPDRLEFSFRFTAISLYSISRYSLFVYFLLS